MNPRSASQIRQEFIDYFVKKCGHAFVPSSPCVPLDDPTLMFTNAGMNQFKPYFLGTEKATTLRVANTQKCIRAGGKHNDLDDVGHDTYHHTFFEMLGNWSFGDYFKKEAITWAWDLLTNVWGVDKTRLHATYFQGDPAEGLEPDSEAAELWRTVTDINPAHIHPGNKKDNFWEMGDTGPCGPCSEIHIDLTPDKSGRDLVNKGDARVMEIWNLVFIQFNRGGDGKLSPLPAKHVDTGMGFERITSVLQGKKSNYDTDVFTPIFAAIQRVTGAADYTGLLEGESTDRAAVMKDIAYRVVADHLRTLTFAITDGAMPSNEGRGYVLRRILRRAVRYGRQYLGTREPFICKLVPALAECMGAAFPELMKNPQRVADVILDEEQSFIKTLDRGIALFEQAAEYAIKHHHGRIGGEDAFKLHDTYGFPVDLTELMAEERGLTVNIGEYERLMEEAREKARAGGRQSQDPFDLLDPSQAASLSRCDDSPKYDVTMRCQAKILWVQEYSLDTEKRIIIATDRTCFYAEQGGQVGDTGTIETSTGTLEVMDVQRRGDSILHCARMKAGAVSTGQTAHLCVSARREAIIKNHTATHILNWALREVLGNHIDQKGSLVDDEKTRFDFSHPTQVSDEQLARVEELVKQQIEADLPVYTKEVLEKKAREINTLRAVFGEKYPASVRVVSIGPAVDDLIADPKKPDWMKYSVEFCGGTHVDRTKKIRWFRLLEESSVAKGIRRIIGTTGERVLEIEKSGADLLIRLVELSHNEGAITTEALAQISSAINSGSLPLIEKNQLRDMVGKLQDRLKSAVKQQAKADTAGTIAKADELLASAPKSGSVAIICGTLGSASVEQLRSACDSLRSRAGSAGILLAGENEGKVVLLAAMTPDVVGKGIKAGDLIKEIAPIVGGKGGGKPDLAQGGGTDTSKIAEAVGAAASWLKAKLG
jgi:alanyl-tRNA synthetase